MGFLGKSIDQDRLQALNLGKVSTKNLMEGLAIDFKILLKERLQVSDSERLKKINEGKITFKMLEGGRLLLEEKGFEVFERLKDEVSDTLKGLACYVLYLQKGLSLKEKLTLVRPFADSDHFGVREWAWIALRPLMIEDLATSLKVLKDWVRSPSENIRRFAIESVRPRGVWCKHSEDLKKTPEMALILLEEVKADPSLYVQKSVGNWLNDAAKSQPLWVKKLCMRWLTISNQPATHHICKRAQRSL